VLAGHGTSRRLAELTAVDGLGPDGAYRLTSLLSPETVHAPV
jgi:type IV secretion system protein VirB11